MIILTPTPNTDKKDNFQFSTVTQKHGFLSTVQSGLATKAANSIILAILFDHTRSVFVNSVSTIITKLYSVLTVVRD